MNNLNKKIIKDKNNNFKKISKEDKDLFANLYEYYNEGIYADGEADEEDIEEGKIRINKEWTELEKKVGRKVSKKEASYWVNN